jgi:hypothetical protein
MSFVKNQRMKETERNETYEIHFDNEMINDA